MRSLLATAARALVDTLRARPYARPAWAAARADAGAALPSESDALVADAAALRAAPCLDARPPAALAAGIVPGAFVLPPSDAARLAARLPDGLVVLAATDADARALAVALRAAGRDARASTGGIAAWKRAGRAIREPAWKSPLPPGQPVRLLPDAARARGLAADTPLVGWVQDVAWRGAEFRYDIRLDHAGALPRLDDLPEEALAALGPRGAAGLGVVLGG